MNKINGLIVTASLLLSTFSYAKTSEYIEQSGNQFYVGADLSMANEVKMKVDGGFSHTESSDLGYNLVLGYEFNTHQVVKTSIEAEYRKFGDVDLDDTSSVTGDADAFFINAKAKLFVSYAFGNIYFAPMIGVGRVNVDIKGAGINHSENDSVFQVGGEFGTRLPQGFDLNLGYRAAFSDIDEADVTLSGVYAGIRYYF